MPRLENKRMYFAYGMNMNPLHMQETVPGVRLLGIGMLDGYRLGIAEHGYASVVPSTLHRVYGVIYELSESEERTLDEFEGVAYGLYRKEELSLILMEERRVVSCLVYVTEGVSSGEAQAGYLDVVISGGLHHGLPAEHLLFLRELAGR